MTNNEIIDDLKDALEKWKTNPYTSDWYVERIKVILRVKDKWECKYKACRAAFLLMSQQARRVKKEYIKDKQRLEEYRKREKLREIK